jgi:hypothetical protein
VASVRADPKPLSKEEQAKIDKAVDRAVAFLKKSQKETGEFGPYDYKNQHQPKASEVSSNHGHTILPGLALLESGVSVNDPAVQKVAKIIREYEGKIRGTYDVSLAILFLDRLGDPMDVVLIRKLALRLIAAQCYTGGWTYATPFVSEQNQNDLWKTLIALEPQENTQAESSSEKKRVHPRTPSLTVSIPPRLRALVIFHNSNDFFKRQDTPPEKGYEAALRAYVGTTDNSNTQFALLALWAARRHGVPVERTLNLVVRRFASSQNVDGSWNYHYQFGGTRERAAGTSRSMTTVGLLGLAMAHGMRKPPKGPAASLIHERIVRGLIALTNEIGTPTGRTGRPIPFEDSLFFLWSVERVAVLYNLPYIGDKDWYRWGAEILVANQNEQGTWEGIDLHRYGEKKCYIQTSYALLFLKRTNYTKELTAKLPFTAASLNESITSALAPMKRHTPRSSGGDGSP